MWHAILYSVDSEEGQVPRPGGRVREGSGQRVRGGSLPSDHSSKQKEKQTNPHPHQEPEEEDQGFEEDKLRSLPIMSLGQLSGLTPKGGYVLKRLLHLSLHAPGLSGLQSKIKLSGLREAYFGELIRKHQVGL